jgi:putative transposase
MSYHMTHEQESQSSKTATCFRMRFPCTPTLMGDAETDVLAYMTFPKEHRVKLHSTNPIERLNGEIKRRTTVVGAAGRPCVPGTGRSSLPNEAAITRLVGAILMEQSDKWAVQRTPYMTPETLAPVSDNPIIMLSAVPGT